MHHHDHRTRILQSTALLAIIASGLALSQDLAPAGFDLSWNTVDGGGGASTSGGLALTGTIGQPEDRKSVV